METRVLRSIQQPSKVDQLLRALVQSANVLPEDVSEVYDLSALPAALRRLVTMATHIGQSWAAWTDDRDRHWLFIAEMSLPLSRERGSPVLQLDQYSDEGQQRETGRWTADRQGKWQRCFVD